MPGRRRTLLLVPAALVLVSAGASPGAAWAQSGAGSSQPTAAEEQAAADRWKIKAGPFVLLPYIRLGQVVLDTNVFYTAEDRRTDVTANGGPGLRLDVPLKRVVPYLDANVNYYWFARSKQERRFGGEAGGGFDWTAGVFKLGASRFFSRRYERPSIEVDRRVLRDEWRTRAYLDLDAGARLRLEPSFTIENREVPAGSVYLGSDLGLTLTEDRYRAELNLKYAVTPKTDFVVVVDQEWSRFSRDTTRDVDSNRLGGGFALISETRLRGQAIGGVRLFRPQHAARGASFVRPFASAALEWIIGSKTRLGANYSLETQYSAFDTTRASLPTIDRQTVGAHFFRRFGRRIELELDGSLELLKNDAPVVIRLRGEEEVVVRDDRFYSARADLGFRILDRLRLGLVASYNERQSNFADFGVDGLLLGASLRFNP